MGDQFNRKTFLFVLPIFIAVGVPLALRGQGDSDDVLQLAVRVGVSLLIAVFFSALVGFYRYFARLVVVVYRAAVRSLAKHAIRSSLRQAVTPMDCVGIMDREGTVHLKIRIAEGVYAGNGSQLRVVEATNDEPWGIIEVVQVTNGDYAICKPVDRQNVEFWQSLERRMKTDTSPPQNIRIVREFPPDFLEPVEKLLNEWR